jgi:hypothetical protein
LYLKARGSGWESSTVIRIEDRRVLVRDDGQGKFSKEPRAFKEFIGADALVLLGDPGMGKSTLFESSGAADCRTVRKFLLSPKHPVGPALFLDGLDEYRKVTGTSAASDTLAKALIALGRPRFRLSCRAADWFGEIDRSVLCEASPTSFVGVLDLLPLTEGEIRRLVGDQLGNAEQLLN